MIGCISIQLVKNSNFYDLLESIFACFTTCTWLIRLQTSILIVNLKSCMTKNDDQRQYAFIFIRVSFIIRDEEEAVNSHFSSGDLQKRKDALVTLVRWSLPTKELEKHRDCITRQLDYHSTLEKWALQLVSSSSTLIKFKWRELNTEITSLTFRKKDSNAIAPLLVFKTLKLNLRPHSWDAYLRYN